MKRFEVNEGRWKIGNLNDALVMNDFNRLMRLHKNVRLVLITKKKRKLDKSFVEKHQHKFNYERA